MAGGCAMHGALLGFDPASSIFGEPALLCRANVFALLSPNTGEAAGVLRGQAILRCVIVVLAVTGDNHP